VQRFGHFVSLATPPAVLPNGDEADAEMNPFRQRAEASQWKET